MIKQNRLALLLCSASLLAACATAPRTSPNGVGERNSELVALNDAFRSITDPDTRRSVVALVCSLAAADPETAPRHMGRIPRGHDPEHAIRPR